MATLVRSGLIAIMLTVLCWGCVDSTSFTCGEILCPASSVCVENECVPRSARDACDGQLDLATCNIEGRTGICVHSACQLIACGDGIINGNEICDDSNTEDGDGCSANCRSNESCGNGVIDFREGCDDGNDDDQDGCHNDCRLARCGDGVVDSLIGERCDEGAANANTPSATCRMDCQLPRCGDDVKNGTEICDDGNLASGDGCSGDCLSNETCGNQYVDFVKNEQCDDGNGSNTDSCHVNCRVPICGDSILDLQNGEVCDAGDQNSQLPDAPCRNNCQLIRCGDGIKDGAEVCDDGNVVSGDSCAANCLSNETCGNRIVDAAAGEDCDSGLFGLSGDGCSSTCKTEIATWTNKASPPPSARYGHSMAFDSVRNQLVMFGGISRSTLADTWIWNGVWQLQSPLTAPSARRRAAMAFDAARGEVVLFGGQDAATDQLLSDTWTWNGSTWAIKPTATAPSPRVGADMAFDPISNKLVLFGGFGSGGSAETWQWDGTTWLEMHPFTSPPGRGYAGLAYDPLRSAVVVFGGYGTSNNYLADTWQYSNGTWSPVVTAGAPPAVAWHRLVFDAERGQLVVFGGYNQVSSGETWVLTGSTWRRAASNGPEARNEYAAAYFPPSQEVILFGGYNDRTSVDDIWAWDGSAWSDRTLLSSLRSPLKRADYAMAYDAIRGETVLFGGYAAAAGYYGDTWTFDGKVWLLRQPVHSPSPRAYNDLVFDTKRNKMVMFGGWNEGDLGDTWEWDGTDWTQRFPSVAPTPRDSYALAYDSRRDRVVLFSGYRSNERIGDTWEWDGNNWEQKSPAVAPSYRQGAAMVYEPVSGRTVLFGGVQNAGVTLSETWQWDGNTWTQIFTAHRAPARSFHSLAYHPTRKTVVMFGSTVENTVWEFNGVDWNALLASGPPPRTSIKVSYDAKSRGLLMLDGALRSTWQFQFAGAGDSTESCSSSITDDDGDSLSGCADPDCWMLCSPTCPPYTTCDPTQPRCGDGSCSMLENHSLCPADC
jgi:cysteine-rich repeat protein